MSKNFIVPLVVYPFDIMVSLGKTDNELKRSLKKYDIEWSDEMICSGGYRWAFNGQKLYNRASRLGKCKISIEKGEFYKEFDSQKELASYLNVRQGSISNAIRRNNKLHKYIIKKLI